jgi:serine/threonine protein kinase
MQAEWKIGDTIKGNSSKYELEKEIGGGAQSTFKAKDLSNKRDVFLKIYADEPRKTNKRFDVFYNQQKEIYKRLANITEITEILYEDFLIDNLFYCSVKEFVKGKNVEKLIEEDLGNLTEKQVLGLAVVFIGALKQIHAQGIIHADLKPAQLFVSQDNCLLGWVLKIKDFDVAHIEGVEAYNTTGTQFYFSPEHLTDKDVTFASDVFTAAIVVAELLTGGINQTFDVGEVDDGTKYKKLILSHKVNNDILKAIDKTYKEGSKISELIFRMLDPKPSKRPQLNEVHSILIEAFRNQDPATEAEGEPTSDESATEETAEPITDEETQEEAEVKPEKESVPSIVKLYGDENFITILSSKTLGKNNFRMFGREKYQYSENEQFQLEKTPSGWKIIGIKGTTNPTLLNDNDITGKEEFIKEDDKIQIGPIIFTVKFK